MRSVGNRTTNWYHPASQKSEDLNTNWSQKTCTSLFTKKSFIILKHTYHMKLITVSWDLTSYSLIDVYWRFGRTCYLSHKGRCKWCYHLTWQRQQVSPSENLVTIYQATQFQIQKTAIFTVTITKPSNFTLSYVFSSEKKQIRLIPKQDAELWEKMEYNTCDVNLHTVTKVKIQITFDVHVQRIKPCLTSPIIILNSMVITLCGETLSSNPGRSTVRAQSSFSSSLWSDNIQVLKSINKHL